MSKKVVYFKNVLKNRKFVIFTEEPAFGKIKFGGCDVYGLKAPGSYGKQYLVKLDCINTKDSEIPKKNTIFRIFCSGRHVIDQKSNKPIENLYWGKI